MTASLFGDVAAPVAPAKMRRASCASGAWESFRRVPADIEAGSRAEPNRKGQYPYEIYHASLEEMKREHREILIEILALWTAGEIEEITRALDRWKRMDLWERQNFLAAIGLGTV